MEKSADGQLLRRKIFSVSQLNVSSCLCCRGNGQNTVRKCSIMSVDVNTAGKASTFLSLKTICNVETYFLLNRGDRSDFPDEPSSSDPVKRYPDWYKVIFHTLPFCYKKPDSTQVNRTQSGGAGDVSSDFISIEGRRKIWWSRALPRLSKSPYGLQESHSHFYYHNTKAINKHILHEGVILC